VTAKLYEVDLPPKILSRGFWLYAWNIVGSDGKPYCYVGMTGDVTGVAQSPFNRWSAHFGFNKKSNAIRRHLETLKIIPEECRSLRFLAYGPILPYVHQEHGIPKHPEFDERRKRVAALEKRLWQEAEKAGHAMLNRKPQSSVNAEGSLWKGVQAAFARHLSFSG